MIRTIRVAVLLLSVLVVPAVAQAAFISFAVTVMNATANPTDYDFSFSLTFPPELYGFASAVGEVTVTPGDSGQASVDLNGWPAFLTGSASLGLVTTDLNVDTGFPPCLAVRAPVTCPFSLVTNTFAPTLFDGLQSRLAFELSGGAGATAVFTGRVDLTEAAVPEPSSLLLLGTGVAAALRSRRRRV